MSSDPGDRRRNRPEVEAAFAAALPEMIAEIDGPSARVVAAQEPFDAIEIDATSLWRW